MSARHFDKGQGQRDEALRVLERLEGDSHHQYMNPYAKGQIYAGLGEIDEAFRWFDVAFRERSSWIAVIGVDPLLDVLRADPRYHDLLRRINFPLASESSRGLRFFTG
jgi:hypothetical protein